MSWRPSIFNKLVTVDGEETVFNAATGASWPIGEDEEVMEALQQGTDKLTPGLIHLPSLGFLVREDKDELEEAEEVYQNNFAPQKELELTMMPTEQCNFRCTYCYETFQKGKMEESIVQGVKTFVKENVPPEGRLKVSWFGGEPLLTQELINDFSNFFMTLSNEKTLIYEAGMTTNGYLLDLDTAESLISFGVDQFQVTLDGPQSDHDSRRKLVDGSGTFSQILSNLISLQESDLDFRVLIRVNFDRKNLNKIDRLLDILEPLRDERFSIGFRPVGKWGGPNDGELAVCPMDEVDEKIVELATMAASRGFQAQDIVDLGPSSSFCYAGKPSSFVIGSDGQIYKCTVDFESDLNQVGQITREGAQFENEKLSRWSLGWDQIDEECKKCSIFPICGGNSCPVARLRGERVCPFPLKKLGQLLEARAAMIEHKEGKRKISSGFPGR